MAFTQCTNSLLYFFLSVIVIKNVVLQDINVEDEKVPIAEVVKTLNAPASKFRPSDSNLTKGTHRWIIDPHAKGNHTYKINLLFEALFLEENDLVTVFKSLNDSEDNSKSIIKPIRAQNGSVTIITDEPLLVVKLEGNNTSFQRHFECSYQSLSCAFTIPPETRIIHSPTYTGSENSAECKYTWNPDHHHREIPVFLFDVFNFTKSKVTFDGATYPGSSYEKSIPIEFFPDPKKDSMSITVDVADKNDYFRLNMHMVDSACSGYTEINDFFPKPISSPPYALDNGTFGNECVWVIKHATAKEILGVAFSKLNLMNALDVVAINDGASSIAPSLFHVTSSNANQTMNQVIRSSGPYLWIAFKPVNYNSEVKMNITMHGQGGHFKGSGQISMTSTVGNDTIFMLEVEENNIVQLDFIASDFLFPASLSIYDGFDRENLMTTLHGNVWYPILSHSSRMMIVATAFNSGSFTAKFSGVSPGCQHMSTLSDQNYVLSGNCNSTCKWIIPPQDVPGSDLLLNLQYFSSNKEDNIKIQQLDAAKTVIGTVDSTQIHIPQITVPANIGALVEVNRKNCSELNSLALIGLSSYIPVCGGKIEAKPSEALHICSPLYPDTYPLYTSCNWSVSAPKKSLYHFVFEKFSLAPNHCLRIFNSLKNETTEIVGNELPDDLFLPGGSSVDFMTDKCKSSKGSLQMVSSEGFMLNGTYAECGDVMENKLEGEFTVNVTSLNQSICMWKINVPATNAYEKGSVNIIAYSVTVKDDKGNYDLKVFDGASVRDPQIHNISTTEVWSRTNNLIFRYERQNVSKPSSVFIVKYKVQTCNSSMLCQNKICMHPDWMCNGINECGDNSDEIKCSSSVPPVVEQLGYSSAAFWSTAFCLLFLGAVLGFIVPVAYEKYKNGQYSRFGDISVIE